MLADRERLGAVSRDVRNGPENAVGRRRPLRHRSEPERRGRALVGVDAPELLLREPRLGVGLVPDVEHEPQDTRRGLALAQRAVVAAKQLDQKTYGGRVLARL